MPTRRWSLRLTARRARISAPWVRTLAERLGTIGYVVELRRLRIAPFPPESMYSLEELTKRAAAGVESLEQCLLPADVAFADLDQVTLDDRGPQPALPARRLGCRANSGRQPEGLWPPGRVVWDWLRVCLTVRCRQEGCL